MYGDNKVVSNHHGGVVRVGDHLYGHSDTKNWVCFDFLKGPDEPEWASGKLDKGSVSFADGKLYCYGQGKGVLVRVDASPDGWKESGQFEIPKKSQFPRRSGHIWTHPVIADGKLLLRDHELLFCYNLKGRAAK